MTKTSTLLVSLWRGWIHCIAFLPLLNLLLAKVAAANGSAVLSIATLFAFLSVPLLQLVGACQIIAFAGKDIRRYERWVWLINAVVSWTVLCADPGGSVNRYFNALFDL